MFGISILTTDGTKTSLDFQSGRFLGSSTVGYGNTTTNVPIPAGVNLATDIFQCSDETLLLFSTIQINTSANTLTIVPNPGNGQTTPQPLTFMFVRFQ